ncbi:MAG: hypothetical protein DRN12_04370 [Thermoplasmata archaeon]|nr:MAG: hypothetical protein DRN12_04370 [Thermoplasmata archaeon]
MLMKKISRIAGICLMILLVNTSTGFYTIGVAYNDVYIQDLPFTKVIDNAESLDKWVIIDPSIISLSLSNDAYEGNHSLHIQVNLDNYRSLMENNTRGFDGIKDHLAIYIDFDELHVNPVDYDYLGFFFKSPNPHCKTIIVALDSPPEYDREAWAKFVWKETITSWTLFYADLHQPMVHWGYPKGSHRLYLYVFPDNNLTEKYIDVYIDLLGLAGKGLQIETNEYRMGGAPGDNVVFLLTVTKTLGDNEDTFNVNLNTTNLKYMHTSTSISSFKLSRYQSKQLKVLVEIPPSTPIDELESVTVEITSNTNSEISKSITLWIRCEDNRGYITIDYTKEEGLIQPIWSYICQLPRFISSTDFSTLINYMEEANITCIRMGLPLKDVFPMSGDPNANPDDPSEYDFTMIDNMINSLPDNFKFIPIVTTVPKVFSSQPDSDDYSRYPPVDYELYGEFVKHVVMHLTTGWADGFHMANRIIYWQIWNEPNLELFWRGTRQEYFKLYESVASKIKEVNESYLVGGPTTAGVDLPYINAFLSYMDTHGCPVDVVDFHHYSNNPYDFASAVRDVKNLLEKYPRYRDAKISISEWNSARDFEMDEYVLNNMNGALFEAAALISLIDSGVTYACHYNLIDSNMSFPVFIHGPFGVFFYSPLYPKPTYYTIKAFNYLSDTRTRISSSVDIKHFDTIAGKSDDKIVLIANNMNYGDSLLDIIVRNLPWSRIEYKIYVLNEDTYENKEGLKLILEDTCQVEDNKISFSFHASGKSLYLVEIHRLTGISITKPKNGLYVFDKKIIPLQYTIIIGGVTINVETPRDTNKVEFYIDNNLRYTDDTYPFSWFWDELATGWYKLKVVAYNYNESATDELGVLAFNI